MGNKKISTGLGAVIVLIIAIIVGISMWMHEKNQTEKRQEAQINILPEKVVEDFAHYKNESYKYEIEVPSSFNIKAGSLKDPDSLIKIISKQDNISLFSVDVKNSEFKNISTWLSNYEKGLSQMNSYEGSEIDSPSILTKEKTIVDGVGAMKLTIRNMPYADYLIVFIKDNLVYKIAYNGLLLTNEKNTLKGKGSNEGNLSSKFQLKHRAELDQIANSFKFTK